MTALPPFEVVADHIERGSGLNRLQARGVVRLALKESGLDAASVTRTQLQVIVAKRLGVVLQRAGIGAEQAESLCVAIQRALAAGGFAAPATGDSPEALFDRLDES